MRNKWLLSLMLAVSLSMLAACNSDDSSSEDSNGEANQEEQADSGQSEGSEGGEGSEQAQMPEADLEDVPDVVAEVNGEEITKEEFSTNFESQLQRSAMQSQMSGQEVDQEQLKTQVADSLVGQELLIQEANSRDYEVTDKEKNKTLEEFAQQQQVESTDKLLATLEEQQGMGEDEVMSQIEQQVKVDKLIEKESGDLEPTEEEMKETYDQLKEQQGESGGENQMPSFEEAKPNIKEQVKMQKESQAVQKLVDNLREDADVTVNL
ncbi:SurA N-terminal domain-containing protein [Thalassobacillus sp. CUG 92003]|uniref:SurA N-terminal domain-containing protein n=1 Tax=Thalassobacillus sp. CUG 92003 TaxID=2736641 RepID=UPI0015E7A22A|nr:SurA N-terminal domain-containing protein [Thalassobacillus sp. CUG 92003]